MSMPGEVMDQTATEGGATLAPVDTLTPLKELSFREGAASMEKDSQKKENELPKTTMVCAWCCKEVGIHQMKSVVQCLCGRPDCHTKIHGKCVEGEKGVQKRVGGLSE